MTRHPPAIEPLEDHSPGGGLRGTLRELQDRGFAFLSRADALQQLTGDFPDWEAFAASWDDLGIDEHMADHGRYRRRRHGVFTAGREGALTRLPDAPHFQDLEYNRLNGGVDRSFLPVEASAAATESFGCLARYGQRLFGALAPDVGHWLVEAHQFRIEARPGEHGQPTPEGVHRDGVDFVLVALVRRVNIQSGTTTIHDAEGEELGEFTLTHPLDLALVDDTRVWHGVTAVEPLDPAVPAYRDVLVLTYRRRDV
ncbi:hypothetical protein Poly30_49640 [Planctomycetes bacterium Poly30]|uniref:2OG-Fe dioxygenase family protein n=1 Tax=Saltatorellus ferox TaxID=2528018 RepID=A0A518EZ93_9BACT|nr:hypothetical protein Poly30_49640 [Planctomycetes bacterium Poly30]